MKDNWVKAAKLDSIPEDDVIGLSVEGANLAFYRYGGEVYATDNVCTHGQAMLSDGWFEDGEIECPLHQGRFCIKTGKALCAPLTEDVKTYPTRLVEDNVEVQIG